MSKNSKQNNQDNLSATIKMGLALAVPLFGALFLSTLLGSLSSGNVNAQSGTAVFLAALGIVSWFMGLRWYGLAGMGLRGKRPLYASIGFAAMGYVVFLIARLFVASSGIGLGFKDYVYLFLFEALAAQLWAFGLLFHALADWRGGLTAAIGSGIFFGALGFLFFQESYISEWSSLVYFLSWGVFYGLVRLRTGSLLGMVIIQSVQAFTAWVALQPIIPPDPAQLQTMYLIASTANLIFIWRLWPKVEEDYRV